MGENRTIGRARWLGALLLAMLAVVAACGGDGGTDTAAEGKPDAPAAAEADGDAAAEFFAGKTLKLVVAVEPGGGFDTIARLVAKHMESHVPGDPTIIVENMPGAGHLIGWNYVTNAAPKDGTVMGNANGSLVLQQLIGADGVEFDMTNIHYLGMPDAPVNMVLVARADAGITDVEQLIDGGTDPLVIGTSAAGDIVQDAATLLKEVVGANVDIVSGYGGDAIVLALEQGETDGWFTSTATLTAKFQDKVDSGEWVVLVQTAEEAEAGFEDVPTLLELVDSDEDRQLILTGAAGRGYVRPYFLPDGVPEERVDALRTAFEATMEDPEFIADMEKAGRMVELVTGDELKDIYTSYIEDTTQEQAAKLKKLLGL